MSKGKEVCGPCEVVDFQAQLLTALKEKNIVLFSSLLQESDAAGEKTVNPNHQYGDPHYATCLDLACKEHDSENFILALLANGGNPNQVNPIRNKAPIHIAIEHGHYKALAALLQDSRTDVNIQDNFGCTALHLAAKNFPKNIGDMEQCVALLMSQSDIKINKRNRKGRTAVHEAVLCNCKPAVEAILKYGTCNVAVDNKDVSSGKTIRELILEKFPDLDLPSPKSKGLLEEEDVDCTTLFEYLYFKQYETFKLKYEAVNKKQFINADDGKYTFLQYACHHGLQDIAKYLLSNGANPNTTISTNKKPPIFLACSGGYFDILVLLLECRAEIAPVDGKTLLHAVVKGKQLKPGDGSDHRKCFELLLERKDSLNLQINATDINGNSALHYAVKEEDQHYTKALLQHDAYIGLENHFGYSPLVDIDPVILRGFLDDCLQSNGKYRRDDKYELTFKYGFLEPPINECNSNYFKIQDSGELGGRFQNEQKHIPELYPLHYISKSQDLRPLLAHPVLLSFLHLKWSHIRIFFYANLIFYIIFVGLLTVHILKDCSPQSTDNVTLHSVMQNNTRQVSIEWVILTLLLSGLILRELFQMIMSPKRYFCSFENCIEIFLIASTLVILSKDWNEHCLRPSDATAVLLSWSELFLQIGHINILSTYNEMMKRVLCNYIRFLVWDLLLIIAFALGFYILFHSRKVITDKEVEENFFQQPHMSLFRTLIMLMGEFDISSIPFDLEPGISFIIFIVFVFLVPIVMVNLLNGLAVSDTQAIKNDAELVSIQSMIETIYYFETMLLGDPSSCSCPFGVNYRYCCWPKFGFIRNLFKDVFLFTDSLPNKELKILPNLSQRIFTFPNMSCAKKKQNYDLAMEADCCGLPGPDGCCKMDPRVLKSAMDIVEKKSEVSERHLIDRLDNIEKQINSIQQSLNRWFLQNTEK